MEWIKKGLIFKPNSSTPWMKKRAYLPTPIVLDKKIRIYFSSMTEDMIGRIGFVEVAIENPLNVLSISEKPCLDIGEVGCFDEHGVTPSCVIKVGYDMFMYYYGWMKTTKAPQLLFTGLAVSRNNGITFERVSKVPILDRTNQEHISRSACFVLPENSNNMWYTGSLSGFSTNFNGKITPRYTIKQISSNGKHNIFLPENNEFGIARPWVIKDSEEDYKMWYSVRSTDKSYYIGYATSSNSLTWIRHDNEVGIKVSESGWDSEMICFASVVDTEYDRIMFYNGNNHGESGFGYAVLRK
jgi:hypothetical protein